VTALPQRGAAQSGPDVAARWRDANGPRILHEFAELLRYPNRARDTADIDRAASYIRDQLQSVGVTSELLRLPEKPTAPPIVYGALTTPAHATWHLRPADGQP
jgi:hypothetical protein